MLAQGDRGEHGLAQIGMQMNQRDRVEFGGHNSDFVVDRFRR